MKMRSKIIFFVVVISLAVAAPCLADGMAYKGRDFSSMRPIAQNEQRAVITHKNGVEKMLIAISLEMEDEDNAIWIFPVPGRPQDVKVDVLDLFPRFSGKEPLVEAYEVLTGIRNLSLLTQIYPGFTCCLMPALSRAGKFAEVSEITVHESIEKWGIRAETITAQSLEVLSDYLAEKKVGLNKDELKTFEHYLDGNYVLVVVWIESRANLLKQFPDYVSKRHPDLGRWPCLYVEFSSQRAFYPLLATSAYGDSKILINLFVLGYVAPDANSPLTDSFQRKYFIQDSKLREFPYQMKVLPYRDFQYTRLTFRGSAGDLKDDLWLKPVSPPGMWFAEILLDVSDKPFILFGPILLYIGILSYLSAGIAGWILYRKWQGFDMLGFFNLFTLVAVIFAARWARNLLTGQIQDTGKVFSVGRFAFVFSITFVALDHLLIWLIWGWAVYLVGA